MQRKALEEQNQQLVGFRNRFEARGRVKAIIPGYLYGDPNASDWEGYIHIGQYKFQVRAELTHDSQATECLELKFYSDLWDVPERPRLYMSGTKTFRGYITYPQWLCELVGFPGNTYSFYFKGVRFGQGQHAVWSISERPRPRMP